MALSEEILEHVEKLPEKFQAEVLDFVEYLESRVNKDSCKGGDDEDWPRLSLSFAMGGLGDESSTYSLDDIKERFS